jgi:hypothetical protein
MTLKKIVQGVDGEVKATPYNKNVRQNTNENAIVVFAQHRDATNGSKDTKVQSTIEVGEQSTSLKTVSNWRLPSIDTTTANKNFTTSAIVPPGFFYKISASTPPAFGQQFTIELTT